MLKPSVWTDEMTEAAKRIPCDAPGDFASLLAAEVREGLSKVATLMVDGQPRGFVVFDIKGTEFIIHAAFGRADRVCLVREFLPHIEAVARAADCDTIRFHTARTGLITHALAHGYHLGEVVMRKRLTDERN